MPVVSTLRRTTTVTAADDFAQRQAALLSRLMPLLEGQPGFLSHEMRQEDAGGMVEVTRWASMDECRAYLRNGGAAMAATILDAFFPTAAYPDGTWVRENTAEATA